jgi:hypothetical protein
MAMSFIIELSHGLPIPVPLTFMATVSLLDLSTASLEMSCSAYTGTAWTWLTMLHGNGVIVGLEYSQLGDVLFSIELGHGLPLTFMAMVPLLDLSTASLKMSSSA